MECIEHDWKQIQENDKIYFKCNNCARKVDVRQFMQELLYTISEETLGRQLTKSEKQALGLELNEKETK